jgi:preprotein translocase subunit SecD
MRRHLIVFLTVLILTGVLSLVSHARVLADLTTRPGTAVGAIRARLVLAPVTGVAPQAATLGSKAQLLKAQRIINYRLEKLGLAAPSQVTVQDGRLEVSLPQDGNTPYVVNVITSIGQIEFINGGQVSPPIGQRVQTGPHTRPNRHIYQTLFTGQEVDSVVPPDSASGQIFYNLQLKPEAAGRFADFVQANPRAYVCMVLDERVINCSRMYHQSGHTMGILPDLGSGTEVSLADLAVFLEGGPLPVALNIVEN